MLKQICQTHFLWVLLLVAASISLAGCTDQQANLAGTNGPETVPTVTVSEQLTDKLVAADLADGQQDKVISKCYCCLLGMDGKQEYTVMVNGFEAHFCAESCSEHFEKNADDVVESTKIPAANNDKSPGEATSESEEASVDGQAELTDGKMILYGSMHQAIGQQQHEGRIKLRELISKPGFYGVAALEGLNGEITIIDSRAHLSQVDSAGKLKSNSETAVDAKATLLVGQYVKDWHEFVVDKNVPAEEFDQFVAETAQTAGVSLEKPFLFSIKGSMKDVHLHVINGACPVHAVRNKIELNQDSRPFVLKSDSVKGTLVGVFANDAVGKITHPGTRTHRHLVFQNDQGEVHNGHLEGCGIAKGSTLRIAR